METRKLEESKALEEMLFDGTGSAEDTPLYCLIENLKRASLTCTELGVTVEFEDVKDTREKLGEINFTLADTWRALTKVFNDIHQPSHLIRQGSAKKDASISENSTYRK